MSEGMSEPELDEALRHPTLRVDLLTPVVQVAPGETVGVSLEVLNTSPVIEQIEVRLLGLTAESVAQTPPAMTLFPEESARVTLDLTFHPTLPAGTHEALLTVTGRSGALGPAELMLIVEVPEVPRATLIVEPPIRSGGRRGAFEVLVDNVGNTELDLLVLATDADRVLDLTLSQRKINLRADQGGYAVLVAQRRRRWLGGPVDHVITVDAKGDGVEEAAEVRFRQRAILTPGVITILTLLLIVLVWAAVFFFGVSAALSSPDPVKSVPEGFLQGIGRDDLDPAVVGGSITGTIVAASTGQPISRVIVEVFDVTGEPVTATASADDGGYELAGLVPARYRLRVRGVGFEPRWWPDAATAVDAGELVVDANRLTAASDLVLAGFPGSIGGVVVAGDGDPTTIGIEVVALDLKVPQAANLVTADDDGVWRVDGLTAPATYRITYSAPGFADVEVTEELEAGGQLALNATRLPAAAGAISGRVQDRSGRPLGGVDILARRGEDERSTTTPTSGDIGAFGFADLETPGTYLLTFSADGFASETTGVRLGPGESLRDLVVVLSDATGVIRGQATSRGGEALGGVTVTVSGGGTVVTTDTLTSGTVGSFRLAGLPLPGIYTVSFDLEGFARETVQVTLDPTAPESTANAVMTSSVGRLTGQVIDSTGAPLLGAAVAVSDGSTVRETTSASAPQDQRGRFSIGELPPGTYTITVTAPDSTWTELATIRAAQTTDVTIRMASP